MIVQNMGWISSFIFLLLLIWAILRWFSLYKKNIELQTRCQLLERQQEASGKNLEILAKQISQDAIQGCMASFTGDTQRTLTEILAPFREKLQDFYHTVEQSFNHQMKEQFSLTKEIQRVVDTHKEMRLQTERLTEALRGDSKVRGTWGEIVLERLLELSGLRKDQDYKLQGIGMGLVNEDGGILKPDVVIYLPEERYVIIDSKVALIAYEGYCSSKGDSEKKDFLKKLYFSVRKQVDELSKKNYAKALGLNTPDFVLLFMPLEGAYQILLESYPELYEEAWGQKVIIVCSSTLMAILKIIASLWRIKIQNEHAHRIALEGAGIYDKTVDLLEDLEKLGVRILKVQSVYEGVLHKIRSGKGNLLQRIERLKTFGVNANKMHKLFIEKEEEECS